MTCIAEIGAIEIVHTPEEMLDIALDTISERLAPREVEFYPAHNEDGADEYWKPMNPGNIDHVNGKFYIGIIVDAPVHVVDGAVSRLLEEDMFATYWVEEATEGEGTMEDGYIIRDFLDVVLEDDDTDTGGVAFTGETVEDFIADAELGEDESIDALNEELVICGIRAIVPEEHL